MIQLTQIEIFVLLVYLSILIEIVIFPVPSVASTYQLWNQTAGVRKKGLLFRVQHWPRLLKICLLVLPTIISVLVYCFPLLVMFLKPVRNSFTTFGFMPESFTNLLGIGLILLGRSVSFFSVLAIRKDNSQQNEEFALKTEGVFSLSRNPILLGMYGTFIGLFFIFPYPIMLAGVTVYLLNMHFRILLEEDFLEDKFGEKFNRYKQSTRRYL